MKLWMFLENLEEKSGFQGNYSNIRGYLFFSALNHPNVVKLIGCCMNPCCLVMEYFPYNNLLKYLQDEKNQVSMVMKLRIALNIAGTYLL